MKLFTDRLLSGKTSQAIIVGMAVLIGIFVQQSAAFGDPDLTVAAVDTSAVASDCQSLTVAGEVSATVSNIGTSGTGAGFEVLFFEDANGNGMFDQGVTLFWAVGCKMPLLRTSLRR